MIIHRVGLGRNLTAAEVDANFDDLDTRIGALNAALAAKQATLIAGPNISIAADGRTISAVGSGGATPLINDLVTGGTSAALTAQQGVVLKGITDGLTTSLAGKQATLTGTGDVPGLTAALAGKQATLTGTTDVPGLTAALATKAPNLLTGLNTSSTADVNAADDALTAWGKLQAKFNSIAATIRGTVLTGLSTATTTDVTSSDSILVAIGKIQGKITAGIGTQFALLTDRVTYDIAGTNTSVSTALATKAPLASPALTGTPTAPTAGAGTNTNQVATTAFVTTAVAGVAGAALSEVAVTSSRVLTALDFGKILVNSSANDYTLTLPTGLGFSPTDLKLVGLKRTGAGQLQLAASGTTVRGIPNATVPQYDTDYVTWVTGETYNYDAEAGGGGGGGGGSTTIAINSQVGTTYTLQLSDAGGRVEMNSAAPNTVTIPANSAVAFPVGTRIEIKQNFSGATTVAINTDTLTKPASRSFTISAQGELAVLTKTASTTWECMAS